VEAFFVVVLVLVLLGTGLGALAASRRLLDLTDAGPGDD
jgi:hypothetical protein